MSNFILFWFDSILSFPLLEDLVFVLLAFCILYLIFGFVKRCLHKETFIK